jgi:hypothetical protein
MQQLEPLNPAAPKAALAPAVQAFVRHWLTGRRGLAIGGVAVVAAGLALGWNWFSAIGVAPIILSLVPCAAMCAIGACAMMSGNASPNPGSPDSPNSSTTTISPARPTDKNLEGRSPPEETSP